MKKALIIFTMAIIIGAGVSVANKLTNLMPLKGIPGIAQKLHVPLMYDDAAIVVPFKPGYLPEVKKVTEGLYQIDFRKIQL